MQGEYLTRLISWRGKVFNQFLILKRPSKLAFSKTFSHISGFPRITLPQQTLWAEMPLYFLAISPFEMLSFSSESLHRKYYFFILTLLKIYLICTDSSGWVNSCSPNSLSEGEKPQWGHKKTQPSRNQLFKAAFECHKTIQTNDAEPSAPRTPLRLKEQWDFVMDSQHSGLSAQQVSWMVTFQLCYSS